ncbi:alpha/beta hydrolase [Flocculibacter collagenilyticus]|uniref:alpha/beta hydrolase n=1 Tax=Flocculibacter collagenilyticus TaxID=2744479 RepID=UPI0018F32C7C|nr:alpha/beta hydrolase-fold protein [Flocculibacter collagenilyticus]
MKLTSFLVLFMCFFATDLSAKSTATTPFVIANTDTLEVVDPHENRPYKVYVKLPVKYDPSIAYPVIYMTDGNYLFPTLAGSLGIPMSAGKITNSFLVGVSWQSDIPAPDSRVRDYTHTVDESWKRKTGEAENYLSFLRNTVIPLVEKKYKTEPTSRTYIGNSLGGLFGGYVLLQAPKTFKNYVLSSPSFWFDNESLITNVGKFNAKNVDANVYISVGELETPETGETIHNMVDVATRFHKILSAKPAPALQTHLNIVDAANHEVAFATSAIQGLYWLSKNNI